ncbi:MAG: hypothetical protein Q4C60_03180 [Eubacteriales bacterium]|nr:hypothetical protein [Eubacteriales bacterium]
MNQRKNPLFIILGVILVCLLLVAGVSYFTKGGGSDTEDGSQNTTSTDTAVSGTSSESSDPETSGSGISANSSAESNTNTTDSTTASTDDSTATAGDSATTGNSSDSSVTSTEQQADSVLVYGTVTEISDGQILLENDDESDPYSSIRLNITETTGILDASDYSEKSPEDIQVGDTLYAYASLAMTRSLPPISNALVIFCSVPQDASAPTYAQITEITTGEDGNLYLTTDRDLILIPSDETQILSLDGAETLSASDLQVGDRIFVRYSVATLSLPAQTNPEEIRLIPDGLFTENNS